MKHFSKITPIFQHLKEENRSELNLTTLILFCQKCERVPIIKRINLNSKEALVFCNCHQKGEKFNFYKIYFDFTCLLSQFQIAQYFKCNYHNEEYRYYCENCEFHFCEKSVFFLHECDIKYLIDFETSKHDIEEKINYINKCLYNLDNDFRFHYLKEIISLIYMQYKKFPNFNIIKNINNIYLTFLKNRENSKEEIDININSNEIINLDFSNNQINTIIFLLKKDLRNLKVLNLHNNKLCNIQINNLKKLNCYNLTILNLSNNFFTDYLLLTVGENFVLLKELNLDTNRLYENIDILKIKLIVYDSVEKLILSNGVFSKETINSLQCLKFKNLKYLDLSSNDLNSFSFIKLINFGNNKNKIEKLILYNNKISITDKDIDFLLFQYLNLKLVMLEEEEDYSAIYKGRKNLPFKIFCFDNNKRSEYLLEQYGKKEKEDHSKNLIEYQQYYDNLNY